MAYKTNDAVIRHLKEQWEAACNGYLLELLNMWDCDSYYGYWVADNVGGLYCYGDDIAINMSEIILCVEKGISMDDYRKYVDYCSKCSEYGFNIVSLEAYHLCCPTVPQETFDKLDAMKANLQKAIEEEKAKF